MSTGESGRANLFLHGGWRCGSTYLWSRFRALDGVMAFYEPFSEKLAHWTLKNLRTDTERKWQSRHPQLDAPYFAEYARLISGSGVCLYEERFAVQRYFVAAHAELEERAYLELLVDYARHENRRAVLGFSRSLGRVGAIKRHFPGCHVVLMRDPLQQWFSGRSYRLKYGVPYFEIGALMILALADPNSAAGSIARWLRLPRLPDASFRTQYRMLCRDYRRLDDALSYRAFVAVYLLSYLEALLSADLVVDMDLLSRSEQYRQSIGAAICEEIGLAADFGDCSLPLHDAGAAPFDVDAIHHEVSERVLNHELECRGPASGIAITGSFSWVMNKLRGIHRGTSAAGSQPQLGTNGLYARGILSAGQGLRRLLGLPLD